MSDVVGIAHITGRRLSTVGNEDKAAYIQAPDEGADVYVVTRAMEEGFGVLEMECGRYLSFGTMKSDNLIGIKDNPFVLTLSMPDSWNYAAVSKLSSLSNSYIRDWCIYSIFEKTCPEEAEKYLMKAQSALSSIKPILELRKSPVVRKLRMY